jgi:hypothetical protein
VYATYSHVMYPSLLPEYIPCNGTYLDPDPDPTPCTSTQLCIISILHYFAYKYTPVPIFLTATGTSLPVYIPVRRKTIKFVPFIIHRLAPVQILSVATGTSLSADIPVLDKIIMNFGSSKIFFLISVMDNQLPDYVDSEEEKEKGDGEKDGNPNFTKEKVDALLGEEEQDNNTSKMDIDPPQDTGASGSAPPPGQATTPATDTNSNATPPPHGAGPRARSASGSASEGSTNTSKTVQDDDDDYLRKKPISDRFSQSSIGSNKTGSLPRAYHSIRAARISGRAVRTLCGSAAPEYFEMGSFEHNTGFTAVTPNYRHCYRSKFNISTSFQLDSLKCNTCMSGEHMVIGREVVGGGGGIWLR